VRRAVEAALDSKASKTIVVTGHARDEIERALAGLPVVFAFNPDFAIGMASSLRAGLAHAADSAGALALLADMPDVTSAILDRLIAAFNCAPDAWRWRRSIRGGAAIRCCWVAACSARRPAQRRRRRAPTAGLDRRRAGDRGR